MLYKEIVKDHYYKFNIMKTDQMDEIKRIKAVKLYPGKSLDAKPIDVVGGIEIVYETKSGNDFVDGIIDLYCKTFDVAPEVLELKDNEYINSIYGTGTQYIKTLNIETNFYRKVKQGSKSKSEIGTPKGGSGQTGVNPLAGMMMKGTAKGSGDNFAITLPAGAKVLAIAGSAD